MARRRQPSVRRNEMRAPAPITLTEAARQWLEGTRAGVIRNRAGDKYKPATVRAYEQSLRLHVLPELGSMKLSAIDRDTLQDLTDELVASGMAGSTVQVALLPVRGNFGRACRRADSGITVNPTVGLDMPKIERGPRSVCDP